MKNLSKNPLKYSPDPPISFDFDLKEESKSIMITADTDSIYFCHHSISESLSCFHEKNSSFKLCNYFLFNRTMLNSRIRIYFSNEASDTMYDNDQIKSGSMTEFPSVTFMEGTVVSTFQEKQVSFQFDIYFLLLQRDKSIGFFQHNHELAIVSAMNLARERLLRSLKSHTVFLNKLYKIGKFHATRTLNLTNNNQFIFVQFDREEITKIFGEFEYCLKAIATNIKLTDGTGFQWYGQWSSQYYSGCNNGDTNKISEAAMELLRYGCCTGSSSNLKNMLLMDLSVDSEYLYNQVFHDEKEKKEEHQVEQGHLEQVIDKFVAECNTKSEIYVKTHICPNYKQYNVIWSRDIGFNFECSSNNGFCYLIRNKEDLKSNISSWFNQKINQDFVEDDPEYPDIRSTKKVRPKRKEDDDDNYEDDSYDENIKEEEEEEDDNASYSTCSLDLKPYHRKLRYYCSCYPIFGMNDICSVHYGMTKVHCLMKNINNKNYDDSFINDMTDDNDLPIEFYRNVKLLDGEQVGGIKLYPDDNKNGIIGFQVYCPSYKAISTVQCSDWHLLNGLIQHLFIVLDDKGCVYKDQYKQSLNVLKSKILPMLEIILDDVKNDLLHLNALQIRLEFMC